MSSTTASHENLLATMKQTVHSLLQGYNDWSLDAILAPRAENCTHEILPRARGRGPMGNQEYREGFGSMMKLFQDFKAWTEMEVFDPESRTAALHMFAKATTVLGPYDDEYAIFIKLTEDGTKIVSFQEYTDGAYTMEYFGRLMKYAQTHGAGAEAGKAGAAGEAGEK